MKKQLITLVLGATLALSACAKHVAVQVPGSVNQFDSDAYATLLTAKASIDTAKAELAAGAFPTNVANGVKLAVNQAVTYYNVLDVTYQAYHLAALAGTATSAQQNAVASAESNLNNAVTVIATPKAQ